MNLGRFILILGYLFLFIHLFIIYFTNALGFWRQQKRGKSHNCSSILSVSLVNLGDFNRLCGFDSLELITLFLFSYLT